jgi:hypothetical protein
MEKTMIKDDEGDYDIELLERRNGMVLDIYNDITGDYAVISVKTEDLIEMKNFIDKLLNKRDQMMEIKDMIPGIHLKYKNIDANIFDDGRFFCAISDDDRWCCYGIIVDFRNSVGDLNPTLQVNEIYKNVD